MTCELDLVGHTETLMREFRKHVRELGHQGTDAEIDSLFESLDGDKSGFLDVDELRPAILRLHSASQDSVEEAVRIARAAKYHRRRSTSSGDLAAQLLSDVLPPESDIPTGGKGSIPDASGPSAPTERSTSFIGATRRSLVSSPPVVQRASSSRRRLASPLAVQSVVSSAKKAAAEAYTSKARIATAPKKSEREPSRGRRGCSPRK